MIRPRLKMARRAITQQQQGQQPGMRDAPQVANQSSQGPAPTTQARARAIYRPGPAAGGAQAPSQTANRSGPGLPGFQTLAYQPVTRPGGISGGPTGVTMENAGDVLREWGDRGYTGVNEVPADPNDLPGQIDEDGATYVDGELEYAEGTEGFEDNKSEEQLIADMVRQYLEGVGNIDTTEQEALINEQMQEKLAMDLMNQRAAAGASGFEASGSLIGMEGDTRRGAARDATGARLDARRQAEEDAFGRAMGVVDVSSEQRRLALEEERTKWQMEALDRWLESQGAGGAGGDGEGGSGDPFEPWTPDVFKEGATEDPGDPYKFAASADELPEGSEKVGGDASNDFYRAPDGTMYLVPKPGPEVTMGSNGLIDWDT